MNWTPEQVNQLATTIAAGLATVASVIAAVLGMLNHKQGQQAAASLAENTAITKDAAVHTAAIKEALDPVTNITIGGVPGRPLPSAGPARESK